MSMQASSSRPATKSIGAAFIGVVLTLLILVVVLLTFLIAPLVALGLAYLVWAVMRSRVKKRSNAAPGRPGQPGRGPGVAAHGFGAGTAS